MFFSIWMLRPRPVRLGLNRMYACLLMKKIILGIKGINSLFEVLLQQARDWDIYLLLSTFVCLGFARMDFLLHVRPQGLTEMVNEKHWSCVSLVVMWKYFRLIVLLKVLSVAKSKPPDTFLAEKQNLWRHQSSLELPKPGYLYQEVLTWEAGFGLVVYSGSLVKIEDWPWLWSQKFL